MRQFRALIAYNRNSTAQSDNIPQYGKVTSWVLFPMLKRRQIDPSLLVVACFSRHAEALDWAQGRLQAAYGAIDRVSPDFSFHHTDYYTASMGPGLQKRLIVFEQMRSAETLAGIKNFTIGLEAEAARSGHYSEERPLNLDPGLLQLGKFLLATTKDQAHRIYLQDGIYAEVTLRFEDKKFECWPWTYADYREPALREFLNEAREALFQRVLELRRDVVNKADSLPSDLRGGRS